MLLNEWSRNSVIFMQNSLIFYFPSVSSLISRLSSQLKDIVEIRLLNYLPNDFKR